MPTTKKIDKTYKKKNLILVRHGQSEWNLKNLFTGWTDVDLTEQGLREAEKAGQIISSLNFKVDIAFTSELIRAIRTLDIIKTKLEDPDLSIKRDWRLNERSYGALQGLNKFETAQKYGDEQVHIWRRSYDIPPPPLEKDDQRHPCNDPKYENINNLPDSESLATTLIRVKECWNEIILPQLEENKNVLITAHGNSLRALVKMLDNVSEEEITQFNIPTGVPILYELDEKCKSQTRRFLGDKDEIASAIDEVANQAKN